MTRDSGFKYTGKTSTAIDCETGKIKPFGRMMLPDIGDTPKYTDEFLGTFADAETGKPARVYSRGGLLFS